MCCLSCRDILLALLALLALFEGNSLEFIFFGNVFETL